MAQLDTSGRPKTSGHPQDETTRRTTLGGGWGNGARTIVIACVFAAGLGGFGLWVGLSPSGVALERSGDAEAIDAPVDPGTSPEAPADPGEAGTTEGTSAEGTGQDGGAGAAEGAAAAASAPEPEPHGAKVHVDGAVCLPGVFELWGDDPRVADAVAAAGGLAEEADTSAVNLAAPVADGDKVHIPAQVENAPQVPGAGEIAAGSSTNQAAPAAEPTASEAPAAQASGSGLVNINTASVEELCALPGVGEKTAQKIVADREASGPFTSPEDLMRVSGIGEKKFEQVRDLVCV